MTTPPAPEAPATPGDRRRPLLVNVMQAAGMLAVSRSSVYQLIWNGQLIPIRIGRSVRFPIEQLEQFVAARLAEGQRDDRITD